MSALSDQLVSLLSPHYSDDAITQLFLPEPYPTPLSAASLPPARPNTEPLFLPDRDSIEPVALPTTASPPTRQTRRGPMVCLPPTPEPPAIGTLEAELAADTAH